MKAQHRRTVRVSVYIPRALYRRMQKIREYWPQYTLSTQFLMAAEVQTEQLELGSRMQLPRSREAEGR